MLAERFLTRFSAEEGKRFGVLAADARAALLAHPWPGNVRELENAIRTAVVLNDGEALTAPMLPARIIAAQPRALASLPAAAPTAPALLAEGRIKPLADLEREAIEAAISLCGGNVAQAAAALGVSPSTLYRKRVAWGGGVQAVGD